MLIAKKVSPLLLIFLLLVLVSCTSSPASSFAASDPASADSFEPYSFLDSEGKTVTLSERPKKVAILFSSYADIWVTAGGTVDITVGETIERGFADEDAILVDRGAGHTTIDLETLLHAQPDLVIGTADYACQAEAVEICRAAGIPAALFRVEQFSDYLDVLKIFCQITGETTRYETYGTALQTQIDSLLTQIQQREETSPPARILFVRAGSSAKSTKAKTTADHFVCMMLHELGTENIADAENGLTGTLSLEVIVEENPDFLFISTMGDENAAKDYMDSQLASEGWRELSCVQNGNTYYLPKSLFHFKPNARWAEAYEYLAALLYPEIFS